MDNVFNVQTVFLLCTGLLTFLCENTVNPFPLPQRVKKNILHIICNGNRVGNIISFSTDIQKLKWNVVH